MGCDIHMYVEYREKVKDVEKWVLGDYFKKNSQYKISKYQDNEYERIELYGNRNYAMFSTLAGVRDYTEKIVPVAEPKGFPDDACDYVKEANEQWDSDGHTHSWLTLKEIKDYQAANPILYRTGLLSPASLIEFDNNGTHPESWCQGTSMEGYDRRDWQEENNVLQPLIKKMEEMCVELLNGWEYKDEYADKIRIVFWFDN